MRNHRVVQFVFLLLVVLFLSGILGSLIHEGAHVLLMRAGGARLKKIVIMPGIQLYPCLTKVKWSGYVAGISVTKCSSQFFRGLSLVMGSSSNAIASYLMLAFVFKMNISRRKKVVLSLISFVLAWDLIGYSVFPFFGLKHWIFIGGNYCEPVEGASMLGIPLWVSYIVIFAHSIFYHFIFVKVLPIRNARGK